MQGCKKKILKVSYFIVGQKKAFNMENGEQQNIKKKEKPFFQMKKKINVPKNCFEEKEKCRKIVKKKKKTNKKTSL